MLDISKTYSWKQVMRGNKKAKCLGYMEGSSPFLCCQGITTREERIAVMQGHLLR